ncbi:DUF2278 family protein [Rhodobium gokarnense]|uniref:Uncharacterized protein YukJ n=1 Tax=Rhodobium gokarnense TaxID=364296 RepID=A0ABT3HCR2_9HYPH|nr:DUF2278 family protein [Rhodobium gokarnense]MCW2308144.1 uncharacterized protein YukJ [Rhodobium gokarnense]
MPIDRYGIWCGQAVRVTAETNADDAETPHIHLFYNDGGGKDFRASINVKSTAAISELALYKDEHFSHPVLQLLPEVSPGFHQLPPKPNSLAIDYIRSNLLDFSEGLLLPHDIPGRENDLLDLMLPTLRQAAEKKSKVFLFGEPYSGNDGIHDVHMNQGNARSFEKYNGVWQDGGLIIEDTDNDRHIAIWLAFGSQAVHTDEKTGNALPGSQLVAELLGKDRPIPPRPDIEVIPEDLPVAIVSALVNPIGGENQDAHSGRPELVYLLNRTTSGISLAGWQLLNRNDDPRVLSSDVWLAPGDVRAVTMGDVPLSNSGGLISLLDPDGTKVDGVSYTRDDAKNEGQIVLFRSG